MLADGREGRLQRSAREFGTFALVTPARDAGSTLPRLAESVLAQDSRPLLWVVVDDNSADMTPDYVHNLESGHGWVRCTGSGTAGEYDLARYGGVVRTGIDYCCKELELKGLIPTFIGVIDADVVMSSDYARRICEFMTSHRDVALATGNLWVDGSRRKHENTWPRGAARIYRQSFLKGVGGFPRLPCPDSCLDFLAFSQSLGIALLRQPSAQLLKESWEGGRHGRALHLGKAHYVLGYSLVRVLSTAFGIFRTRGASTAAVYWKAYLEASRRGEERVSDSRILQFTRYPLPLPVTRVREDGATVFRKC